MKAVILEDEPRAASHLERMLARVDSNVKVVARLESVRDSVKYFQQNGTPDILFSDVQLADGLSFAIFGQINIQCPIIFTTAYDHYAIEAFKTNGIDYLLKPVEEERLKQALEKAGRFMPGLMLSKLLYIKTLEATDSYKSRFLVKVGDKIRSVPVDEIMLFFSQEKSTFLLSADKHCYAVDFALEQIAPMLEPAKFFRINRKYIVSISACTHILSWSNSRLLLKVDGVSANELVVARERVQEFKNWLDR